MLDYKLSEQDLAFWEENHYLVLRNPFPTEDVQTMKKWVADLFSWPDTPGKWMKYYEKSNLSNEKLLCRVENFIPFHPELKEFICSDTIFGILEQLMGEPAVLFKEKINAKLGGASGFGAHQDAPAFITFGQKYHITMMVAVDDATRHNGCMEFSDPVEVYKTLPQAPGGTIDQDVEKALPWRKLEANAGDIVFFNSYIPHRSPTNDSEASRRAMYITYNRKSEGERRSDYFDDKRQSFPQECERIAGMDYSAKASLYNLGNPIN